MIWPVIGTCAALLTTFGFVPQIIKMRRTRSVNDVSIFTLIQFFFGIMFWTLYGIHLHDPIITASNATAMLIVLAAIITYLIYRKNG